MYSDTDIPLIVITGGPQGGKSSILGHLKDAFEAEDYTVEIVPEAATQLIIEGQGPTVVGMVEFQHLVLERCIRLEDAAKERLSSVPGKRIIFADRGVMDGAAYVAPDEMRAIWDRFGLNRVMLRDERYDGVIFLESVAVSLPHLFSNATNAARYEANAEIAAEVDRRTLEAWIGTPHLAYIDNSTDYAGKIARAIDWAKSLVSGIERERKFLITCPFDRSLLPAHARRVEIRQSYILEPGAQKKERLRRRGEDGHYLYYRNMKRKIEKGCSHDVPRRIPAQDFAFLHGTFNLPDHAEVVKDRWCFVECGYHWEFDVFRDWEGLLLEVELPDLRIPISLPPRLRGYAVDVTGHKRFSSGAISREIAARQAKAA